MVFLDYFTKEIDLDINKNLHQSHDGKYLRALLICVYQQRFFYPILT
jgi:hypothetical protein